MKIKNTGLTLVEIMIVLTMIGIVSAIAFPTMMPIIRDNRVKAETRKTADMLKLARMTALRDSTATTINISSDHRSITMTQLDAAGKDKLIRSVATEYQKILITSNYPQIRFKPDGTLLGEYPSGIPELTISDGTSEYYIDVRLSGLAKVAPSPVTQ